MTPWKFFVRSAARKTTPRNCRTQRRKTENSTSILCAMQVLFLRVRPTERSVLTRVCLLWCEFGTTVVLQSFSTMPTCTCEKQSAKESAPQRNLLFFKSDYVALRSAEGYSRETRGEPETGSGKSDLSLVMIDDACRNHSSRARSATLLPLSSFCCLDFNHPWNMQNCCKSNTFECWNRDGNERKLPSLLCMKKQNWDRDRELSWSTKFVNAIPDDKNRWAIVVEWLIPLEWNTEHLMAV